MRQRTQFMICYICRRIFCTASDCHSEKNPKKCNRFGSCRDSFTLKNGEYNFCDDCEDLMLAQFEMQMANFCNNTIQFEEDDCA